MIKALIIEDEKLAAEHLQNQINRNHPDIKIIDITGSISNSVNWLNNNSMPDLIFLDIQLSDGLSFEIFNRVNITCPIIFTTSYEEYALKAFKVNSIDYLLKPVNEQDLSFAINQFMSQSIKEKPDPVLKYKVEKMMNMLINQFKTRFIVNAGVHIRSIEVEKINCFYSFGKATYLLEDKGKSYDINYSLERLEELVDLRLFFRVNRKYLININSISDIISYSKRKLKIIVDNVKDDDILVSRSRISDFKNWLER